MEESRTEHGPDPPQTPSAFMKPRPSIPSSLPTKLTVNFVLPYAKEFSGENFDGVEQYARNKRIQVALTEKWADKYKNKLSAPWLG